jgi:hypothetical protein
MALAHGLDDVEWRARKAGSTLFITLLAYRNRLLHIYVEIELDILQL